MPVACLGRALKEKDLCHPHIWIVGKILKLCLLESARVYRFNMMRLCHF